MVGEPKIGGRGRRGGARVEACGVGQSGTDLTLRSGRHKGRICRSEIEGELCLGERSHT